MNVTKEGILTCLVFNNDVLLMMIIYQVDIGLVPEPASPPDPAPPVRTVRSTSSVTTCEPRVVRRAFFTDRISLSQVPPKCGAFGGLKWKDIFFLASCCCS